MKTNFLIFLLLIFVSQLTVFSQKTFVREVKKHSCLCKDEKAVLEYFKQFETQEKFIAQCQIEAELRRKSLNLPIPKRVSGFGPSPVSLVKPYYPKIAKKFKIDGQVVVEVFTDEKGLVIYSKILKGNPFLRESVRKAACLSKFTPILYCGKPIKARWLIRYNFISN